MATRGVKHAAKEASAQDFNRKTTKYWVHPDDIEEVKKILGENIPEFRFSTKISKMVQSLYLDNDCLRKYYDRIMLIDQGMIFRYRWYGQGAPPVGFMEQKIRRLGYLNTEKSVKRRCKIATGLGDAYIKGDYIPTETNTKPQLKGKSLELAHELQEHIVTQSLKPMIRTAYVRSCYQKSFDAPLRVSFDEELQFSLCKGNEFLVCDSEDLQPQLAPHEKYDFPHAILEIKVRLEGQGRGQLPPWCQDLIDRKLITAMDKFSKFNTAVAVFFHKQIDRIPYYFPLIETHKPAPKLDFLQDYEMDILDDREDLRAKLIREKIQERMKDKRGNNVFHMQVERTFLKWLRTSVALASIGVSCLATNLSPFLGAMLIFGGVLVGLRAVYIYHYRSYIVRRGRTGHFYDWFGPVLASCLWIFAVLMLCYTENNNKYFIF